MFVKCGEKRHKKAPRHLHTGTDLPSIQQRISHPLMNKAQLIDAVQEILGGNTSKRAASEALDAVLQAITQGVNKGPVQLIGFGTFKPVDRNARMGRNP